MSLVVDIYDVFLAMKKLMTLIFVRISKRQVSQTIFIISPSTWNGD
jgi:hypothetical protein